MAMSKKKNSVAVNTVRTLEDIEIKEHDFELAGDKQNVHMDNTFVNISFWKDAVKRFRSNKMAVVSLVAILLIILLAVVGPMISGHTYASMDTNHTNLPPRIPGLEKLGIFDGTENGRNVYQEKGLDDVYYWFGTDTLGRDLWTRTWAGTRVSLIIAFFAALGDLVIGVTLSLIHI